VKLTRKPPRRPSASASGLSPFLALAALAASLSLAACGSSSGNSASSSRSSSGGEDTLATLTLSSIKPTYAHGGCPALIARSFGEVASRIYEEAGHGDEVAQAVGRVKASPTLRSAIASGDSAGADAALRALLVNQIVRIQIDRRSRPFASAGSGAAVAPVRGSIPHTDASFVLSTQAASAFASVTRQVTGAHVVLYRARGQRFAGTVSGPPLARVRRDGPLSYGRSKYETTSIAGTAYPSSSLRIALLVPAAGLSCPGSAAQARVETLGHVGERIYQEELHSPYVLATLRHIEADKPFQQAVAARDTTALRAAIVELFAAHIHVVRVRAYAVEPSGAERFLYDLGGPYVLAPVHGDVVDAGKLVGHFSFAIQDDAGYLKLAHLFTGAEVLMRAGEGAGRQVMGTLDPGPASVPDRGAVSYRGRSYEAYSFTGVTFPAGPLRISLLLAQ
jgi:hypothetical protein